MERDSFSALITGILFLAVCAYGAVFAWKELGGGVKTAPLTASCVTVGSPIEGIAVRNETALEDKTGEYENGVRLPAGNMASCSVLYFNSCDGYEYLTPELFYGMDRHDFEELLISEPPKGKAYGRLVKGFEWYIAAISESGEAPEGGSRVTLELQSGEELEAECVSVSPGGVMLLRLTEGDSDCSLRRLSALLAEKKLRGFEIPPEALHRDSKGTYIFLLRSGRAERVKAEILYEDKNVFLVDAPDAMEGEQIIISGKDIYDGKVIS